MEFTTCLELHSQATRLSGGQSPRPALRSRRTGLSPSLGAERRAVFQRTWAGSSGAGDWGLPNATFPSAPSGPGIRRWARVSLFARRYLGNHLCFLFLRSMICLNSAGSLVQPEVEKLFFLSGRTHVLFLCVWTSHSESWCFLAWRRCLSQHFCSEPTASPSLTTERLSGTRLAVASGARFDTTESTPSPHPQTAITLGASPRSTTSLPTKDAWKKVPTSPSFSTPNMVPAIPRPWIPSSVAQVR
jgi:hypothetical protein